jgi:hypothetical protein
LAGNGTEVIPSAKRMVRSLRDMGYEFATAVADLIDNCIEAKANTVRVNIEWEGAASHVLIADNGEGMAPEVLKEALRFGSERDYEDADLGKFGLGLKTASLSQCLKVTVASRRNPNRADIVAYCWDVEHIEATNRWEILSVKTTELPLAVRLHLKETTGTVVIWEHLDRELDYKNPDGEPARKRLAALAREVEEHTAMVFHRFLNGEVRGKRLAIYVNENKVQAWDPFARTEPKTQQLEQKVFRIEGLKGKGDITIEPFVLPSQALFSSPEAFTRASGPRKWNAQQGFYIYRADRLIQSGGWCGLRQPDEHRKLSRIAISFNPRLDDEFKINVPKMRVALPGAVKDDIEKWIRPAVKVAEDVYRNGKPKTGTDDSGGSTTRPSPTPATPAPTPTPTSATNRKGLGAQPPYQGGDLFTPPPSPQPSPVAPGRRRATRQELDTVASLLIQVALPGEMEAIENALARARPLTET